MSHIHIPDGVLPVSWWIIGYVITAIFLLLTIRRLETGDLKKKIPYLGVVCALMLITMSVPLGFLPFHINLTVLTGILAGPGLGFVAVFIVNLFLSFLGHGGITVVGVNTLILGVEVFMGSTLFRLLRKRVNDVPAVAFATVFALLVSTVAMTGIVGLSQIGWQYAMPHHHGAEAEVVHPVGEQVTTGQTGSGEGSTQSKDELGAAESTAAPIAESVALEGAEHSGASEAASSAQHQGKDAFAAALLEVSLFKISGLFAIAIILCLGIALEALVTVLMIRFFKQVRPDLLD